MKFRTVIAILALSALAITLSACQQAQSYPTKGIEYVVHASAGGGADVLARTISDIMSKEKIVTQPITVVNKTGGGGAVASAYVAEKKADPYVLYNVATIHITTPLQGGTRISFKDFTPVALIGYDSNCVAVKADSPYKTVQDLANAAKSGKKLTQGGGSIGSTEHLTGYAVQKALGAQWEFISFNSGAEALTALLGGHIDLAMPNPSEAIEQARAGKIRILAVTTDKRIDTLPDVPTFKELNIPFSLSFHRGIVMPKDVPADAVKYWETALQKTLATDTWKKYALDNSIAPGWMVSKEYSDYISKQDPIFKPILDEMGLTKKN